MRIAIIGAGVSGLVAARLIRERHEVVVFEARERIGGHVHTVPVRDRDGMPHAVDTGFIVFNESNYPLFTRLLDRLGVASQPSEMSFSVRCDRTGLEYNGSSYTGLFVQRRNLLRLRFHRMLVDILRFNRRATRDLERGIGEESLGAYVRRGRFTRELAEHYLVPMGSALWSMPPGRVLELPAAFFLGFFAQHGMLSVDDRPQWRVIRGGSRSYVDALVAPFREGVRTGGAVRRVTRHPEHVLVDGEAFDEVVFACHADRALAALGDPTREEHDILGAFPYTDNDVVLHTDVAMLPTRRKAWASWNYRIPEGRTDAATVTYNMNTLQGLRSKDTFCVTLNEPGGVNKNSVLFRTRYRHPGYSAEGFRAQSRHPEISGREHRTHYAGAYWGFGFHEDGVRSAVRVAGEFGATL
ncbi:MAG: FAD-dependent oxidoreductase [Gemmatimonadota bacterium]|nr:FAD-dependent oxidoreductase [Gemmatimonadota bacterium]